MGGGEAGRSSFPSEDGVIVDGVEVVDVVVRSEGFQEKNWKRMVVVDKSRKRTWR